MDGCGGAQVRVTSQRHAILFSSFSFLVKTIINPKSQIPNPKSRNPNVPLSLPSISSQVPTITWNRQRTPPLKYHPSSPKCRRSHGIANVLVLDPPSPSQCHDLLRPPVSLRRDTSILSCVVGKGVAVTGVLVHPFDEVVASRLATTACEAVLCIAWRYCEGI
jgi:hypothetical protein